ncbi:CCT domain [Phytophthora cactorum]|nr:CCT domain [Phytophthora cactorum]
MKNPLSPIEESKTARCLSPQEKLKSATVQRSKRSHASGVLAGASDSKKARLDDMFQNEFELDLDGWISDDYVRAMDFDDRLNQDIDWVAHDEMDLTLSMDALAQDHTTSDDVNDFGFGSTFLRGGLAFEDPRTWLRPSVSFCCLLFLFVVAACNANRNRHAIMACLVAERTRAHPLPFDALIAPIVDPAYIRLESSTTKDAEKLLMSFDTMNFKIPSPTSTSSKKRTSIFSDKDAEAKQVSDKTASTTTTGSTASSLAANSAAAEELRKEQARVSAASSSTSVDSLLSVLNVGASTPKPNSTEKKIGSYSPAARKLRLQKFHEKRKNRTWKKSIKYDCRKKLADDRPRIKGRFVRVLENAGDAKTGTASRSASPPSSAGYAPDVSYWRDGTAGNDAGSQTPGVGSASSDGNVCKAADPAATSVAKPAPVPTAPATSAATLPFARMIASV